MAQALRAHLQAQGPRSAVALALLDRYLRDASGELVGLRTVLAPADTAS